ncbi:helix-turn-helix domain-containing protein [Pseudonocardia sp. CA-142604]|uniref:helix-turn-helix domain-containing protein n=1 Tax=Pseudonocardia sp. CA-142604 TaxID=3240024 RepID=UPI003D93706A
MPNDRTHTPPWEGGRVMVHAQSPNPTVLFADEPLSAELCSWLDAIAEITRAANRIVPLEELLELIAGATARLTGYEFCAVFVEDQERGSLVIRASYGLSPEYVAAINAQTPIPVGPGDTGEGPSSRAFRSQRPTTVYDISADAASRAWETVAAQQGYYSLLSVPLVVGQVPFGVLNCYTADRHEFSAREIILMESMANQAGLAIETIRKLAEAQEHARVLRHGSAALRAELEAAQHAEANHGELLRVVLKGGGVGAIAESLATRLRCTVLVDDAAGRLITAASVDGRPATRDGRCAALHEQARSHLADDPDLGIAALPAELGPVDGSPGLVVPVVLDEDVAGHLWALCPRAPLGPPHRQALVRAAAVVAFALLKERTAQEVEWRLSRDFFDDLLDAEGQSSQALHARARQLGADLTEPHTVLVIRRDAPQDEPTAVHEDREAYAQRSLLSLVQRTGATWKGATLTATRSDHVVVLWRENGQSRSAAEFAHHLRREILAYAGGWTATIGVGPTCVDVQEYGDAYRLTSSVLDLVQQSDRRDRVVTLDEIGAYRLLLQVKRPRELRSFAQAVLGTVHAYDEQHQSKLGLTLRTYTTHRCNAALTAGALHVHPNTVSYRLRRIERLLGIELDDPQTLLHVQLALMIENILGD